MALGAEAGTDPGIGSNNIYIGDPGFAGDTNVISIGAIAASGTPYENTFVGGIYDTVTFTLWCTWRTTDLVSRVRLTLCCAVRS